MSDHIAEFYSGPTRQSGGGSRQLSRPMTQGSKYAIPIFKGSKEKVEEPKVPAAAKSEGVSRVQTKRTFDDELEKVERLKQLSRSKKAKGKPLYQYTPTGPPKQPYKRSRIGQLLGDNTY